MRLTGMTVGFLDPKPGAELDFNRWYDLDHIPENIALPGHVGARRYVATAEDIALRPTPGLPEFEGDDGAYCTVYLLNGEDLIRTRSIMHDLARRLSGERRMFPHVRAHNVHTWSAVRFFTSAGL